MLHWSKQENELINLLYINNHDHHKKTNRNRRSGKEED